MTIATFRFAGADMHALPSGALFIPAAATLVVADLHLEKGSGWARHGALLPPYDSRATLDRVARCIEQMQPRRVLCLGDSFDDRLGPERMTAADRLRLQRLTSPREWIWVAGNHDPGSTPFFGGTIVEEIERDGIAFRHRARAGSGGYEISGHFHPKASMTVGGRRISGRCFVSDGRRLVLPAYGAYAGGLDVFDPALTALLAPRFQVHLIGRRKVHSVVGIAQSRVLCPRGRDDR
jgi:hypothetical protein